LSRTSLVGKFRDPSTRPRAIILTGVGVLVLAVLAVAGGVIATSTIWFCATPCHKVQADTIASYEASSHSQISCMACHEPVNATPIQFAMAKLRSMGELPPTIMNKYELPLNKGSAYALNTREMGSKQCTQCHTTMRKVTPSAGVIIDHEAHAKDGVTCTTCHNRVAHNDEAIELKLPGNVKHEDFTKMDACFRCHDLEGERRAKGECNLCHTPEFALVPSTHAEVGWLPKGHANAATESLKKFGIATVEAEELVKEGVSEEVAVPVEHCSTCHKTSFCDTCHAKLADALRTAPKAAPWGVPKP